MSGRELQGRQKAPGDFCAAHRVSLDHLPRRSRIEAWNALLGGAHDIAVERPETFQAQLTSVALDAMLVHRMSTTPQASRRTPKMIRRDGMDHIVLHMCASPIKVQTEYGDLAVPAGHISLNDLSRPYVRDTAAERDSIILVLSRDLVTDVIGDTSALHGVILGEGAGALFETHMQALAEGSSHLTREAAPYAARATAALLAACLQSAPGATERARAPLMAAAQASAKRFIESSLGDPNLSPELVWKAVGVSRATLYRLFAPLGGIESFIQERRLRLVRRRLSLRRGSETIAAIGYQCGFRSNVHLSRAFKRRYGCSPQDYAFGAGAGTQLGDETSWVSNWLAHYG